jgi:hypothetical protein
VHTVIVEGKVVVEGGRCVTVNEHEVLERARTGYSRVSSDLSSVQPWFDLARDLEPYVVQHYQEWELEKALVPWSVYNTQRVQPASSK